MDNKTSIFLTALVIIPLISGTAYADFEYYGAYPHEDKMDATHVYTRVDMSGIDSGVSDDVIQVTSAAHADSSDDLTGYVSQVILKYDDSESDIELHSEVYGFNSSLGADYPYDCEIETLSCQDLGTASTIVDMQTFLFWSGGDVKFWVGVDYTGGTPSDTYENDDYDPGGNSEESPTQFQTGKVDFLGDTFKLVQWAVESENDADNWVIEMSDMATYSPSTGFRDFEDDTALTVEVEDSGDSSWITYRIEGQFGNKADVGEGAFCVQRNGNTDGIIEFEDATSCLAAPTTLWS